jgi:uncharacterized protein with HEPN domain
VPPSLSDQLSHILEAIDRITLLLEGQSKESLAADWMRQLALERALEVICEAARHIPETMKAKERAIDWRGLMGLGNLLRHAYHGVNIERLLMIAEKDLPPLRALVEKVMKTGGG